ncbi:MAG: tripartite tricarboxylate transporter substrate-binding protein [Cupriavidus necator]
MDTFTRRSFGTCTLATLAAGVWPVRATAQGSGQTGKIIVGYPAGGTLDQTARRVADAWRKQGRVYVVDNRAGAAGRIANSQLKRERADGSAVLCTHTSALTIYPHVYAKLVYDAAADFVPVTPVVAVTCALAVSSIVPLSVKTLADYVKWTAQTPMHASYASPAAGSMAHFLGFQFSQAAGLKLQHIAYRGSAPAMQDLLGGQIAAYLGFVADFLPYLQSSKLRILGVTGEKRSRFMPGVPTFVEQGFATVKGTETYGLFAPPGTPESTVKSLYESVVATARDESMVSGFEQVGLEPFTLPPAEYLRMIQREREAWGAVVQASGFRSED